jgi:integrase
MDDPGSFAVCGRTTYYGNKLIFKTVLGGLRVGEMTQIQAEDIDFQKGYLHIQAAKSKGKRPRTVVLLPR